MVGKAVKLVDIIGYQAGAVVSRTVIDKTVGTVTLFAFDAGQGLSEHTAPFDALVYILGGVAEVTIAGDTVRVEAGEMLIMPANKSHSLRAPQQFKMMLVMVKS
ncbi:cupin domain-containing protein [Chloroflexota bacterium]